MASARVPVFKFSHSQVFLFCVCAGGGAGGGEGARLWFQVQLKVKVLSCVCASRLHNMQFWSAVSEKQLSTLLNRIGPSSAGVWLLTNAQSRGTDLFFLS